MEHPVLYVAVVTRFLDRMIDEHGDYLYMVLCLLGVIAIARLLAPRTRPTQPPPLFHVVVVAVTPSRRANANPPPLPADSRP